MAEDAKQPPAAKEPGAPISKDELDPDLIKLPRRKAKIGVITAAGVVFLSAFFLLKLNPDRRFAGSADAPATVSVADIAAGKVDRDKLVTVQGELTMAHAIRAANDKKTLGLRVVPMRGSDDKLWIVLPGDGYGKPSKGSYTGRLRELNDLPFASTVREFVAAHPQAMFGTAAAVRAGFSSNKVATVGGETVDVRDGDRVGFDVVDPNAATIDCTFNEHHEDIQSCAAELTKAGITTTGTPRPGREQAYFDVTAENAVATTTPKLEAAKLWGMRVDRVTRHYETTWGKLKSSSPAGFTVDTTTIPDAQLDLIGLYVMRSIPSDAYALIMGESPEDYWYVLPVTIILAIITLLFAWALVRAVKRDLLPTRA